MKRSRVLSEKEQVWQQNLAKIWFAKKKELGLTQESAAAKAGWKTQSAFSQFLNGGVALNIEAIIKIASALEVHPAEIAPELASLNTKKNAVSQFANIETRLQIKGRVPLISWGQAGDWCEAVSNMPPEDAEDWLAWMMPHSQQAICLRISDPSMLPDYRDGEIILVDPEEEAIHGSDVVITTPDNNATFKRLQITPDGTYLLALNPDWKPRFIEMPLGSRVCGVVIGSWMDRRYKGHNKQI